MQVSGLPISHMHIFGERNGPDGVRYGPFAPPLQPSARVGAAYKWKPWSITKLVAGQPSKAPSGVLTFASWASASPTM